ncbi:hypothetical protein HDU86_003836 [Geranomyces michiganensis]|nr:hypothetical protein HDU86_003836 [Geranomyces michiganensis]
MHSSIATSLLALSLASAALAQSAPYLDGTWRQISPDVIDCGPDIIVDDFSRNHRGIGETATRQLDLLEGDYGQSATGMTTAFSTDGVTITPTAADAFFFLKFDAGACYDLSSISAFAFDVIAPAGGSFDIGLTQKSPDCHQRVGGESGSSDSLYQPLTKYITPNGQKQTVAVPLFDLTGKPFDFAHTKDLTMINWKPAGAKFVLSNIRLRRACGGNGPNGTNKTVSAGSTGAAVARANATSSALPAATSAAAAAASSATSSAGGAASTGAPAAGQAINPAAAQSAASKFASPLFAVAAVVFGAFALL